MKGTPKWMWIAFGATIILTAALFIKNPGAEKPRLDPSLGVADSDSAQQLELRNQENHPVTPEMTAAARRLDAQAAPDFTLQDIEGKEYRLPELVGNKPLLIFFIEKNCPCCIGAKFFVDRMRGLYPDELNAIGIINADANFTRVWIKTTNAQFPVLLDPEMKTIWAYKADRGVYTVLVDPEGKIVKAYPGYSKASLQELSAKIAKIAGVPVRKLVSAAAPDEMTSGCAFPSPPEKL